MDQEIEKTRQDIAAFLQCGQNTTSKIPGVVFHPGSLPVVHFHGTRLERAIAAGSFCRPFARRISGSLFRWIVDEFGSSIISPHLRPNAESFCKVFIPGMARLWLWHRLPHDLKQELRQMCRAAGVNSNIAAFIILLAEFEMLLNYRGCSTIAAGPPLTKPHELIMGRNLDFDSLGLADALHLVQVHHPEEPDEIPSACLGWLGFWGTLTGWNKAGLSLACTVVYNSKKNDEPRVFTFERAVPMAWAYTRLLRHAPDVKTAVKMLHQMKPMAPSNVMLADSTGKAVVVEWAPNRMICRPMDNDLLVATNGFRTPEMFSEPDICDRYDGTMQSVRFIPSASYNASLMRRQLHSVNQGGLTLHSAIFEPVKRRVHVAINPPPSTRGDWHEIDWDIWSPR